jgi:hypothetical protein
MNARDVMTPDQIAGLVHGAKDISAASGKIAYVYFDKNGEWHISTKRPGNMWVIRAYPEGRTEGLGMWADAIKAILYQKPIPENWHENPDY